MLTVNNLSKGKASDYFKKDDYYTRDENGIWQGDMKEVLGLTDQVTKADFDQLLDEQDPRRVGIDLTFKAPKSVSIASFLNDDLQKDMFAAHNQAVEDTLLMIEKNEIYTRETERNNTKRIKTGMMLCGKFNHFVSRDQDPLIHTHCVIINKTLRPDGKLRAVDNDHLYKYQMLYGYVYQTNLANNLQKMGYEINFDSQKNLFELAGVNREQIEFFSKRRHEILEWLKKKGLEYNQKNASKAAEKTRKAKENKDFNLLVESWREQAKEQGFNINIVKHDGSGSTGSTGSTSGGSGNCGEIDEGKIYESFDNIMHTMSNRTFAIDIKQFATQALKKGLEYRASITNVQRFIDLKRENKDLYMLGDYNDATYFCTRQSYEIEQSIFRHVAEGKNQIQGINHDVVKDGLEKLITPDQNPLTPEQSQAVFHICNGNDRFSAVQGYAGVGKTYMLNTARQVLEQNGYTVVGICPSGKAAQELKNEAGMKAQTIHSFLNSLEKEAGNFNPNQNLLEKDSWNISGLAPRANEVWVIDEASMVDNKTMKNLMDAAVMLNAKVILTGDRRQMLPVGAGNSYDNMIQNKKINYVEITDIIRQKDPVYLESVKRAVDEGSPIQKSLSLISDRVVQISDYDRRLNHIADEYSVKTENERRNMLIVTGANRDRRAINERIRANLKGTGYLKDGIEYKVKDRNGTVSRQEFSPKDRVMFLMNDRKLDVQNGQVGYVKKVLGNYMMISVEGKDQNRKPIVRDILIDTRKYNQLDYGYAMTNHKAQGMTVDNVMLNIDNKQRVLNSRNSYYVGISRGRYNLTLYTDDKNRLARSVSKFQVKLTSDDFSFPPSGSPSGSSGPSSPQSPSSNYVGSSTMERKNNIIKSDFAEYRNQFQFKGIKDLLLNDSNTVVDSWVKHKNDRNRGEGGMAGGFGNS